MRRVSRGCFLFLIVAAFCPATIARDLVVGLPLLKPYAIQRDSEISGIYVEILQAVFMAALNIRRGLRNSVQKLSIPLSWIERLGALLRDLL